MKTADGTVDGTGKVIGSAGADYRNGDGYVLSGPEFLTVFSGLTGAARCRRSTTTRRGARCRPGATLRQPGRPVPGRHGVPGRVAPERDHGPRVLHPHRDRGLGLPQRGADQAVDVRLEQQLRLRRPGQPQPVRGRRRRRRQGRDRLRRRWRWTTTAARPVEHRNGHGDAMHVGDLDPVPPRSGGVPRLRGAPTSRLDLDGRRPDRAGAVVARRPAGDNGRGVSADIYAGCARGGVLVRPSAPA